MLGHVRGAVLWGADLAAAGGGVATGTWSILYLAQERAQAAGGDLSLTMGEIAVIGSIVGPLVAGLVFVHKLLMKAKDDEMSRISAAHGEYIAKLEGANLAIIAAKDETVRLYAQRMEFMSSRVTAMQDVINEKDRYTLDLLSGVVKSNEEVVRSHTETVRQMTEASRESQQMAAAAIERAQVEHGSILSSIDNLYHLLADHQTRDLETAHKPEE